MTSNHNHRYDKVTMGVLMRDFVFDKNAPKSMASYPRSSSSTHMGGGIAAGPLHREKGTLHTTINPEEARRSRKPLDVSGHYGRPDIFHLEIDRRPTPPLKFIDEKN